jgi:SPP1 family predicted phage head-tail adaptor
MMNKRVKVAKRVDSEGGSFGRSSGGQKYTMLGEFWAAESFNKGVKSMREGAVDAYDTVMFRMRYHAEIDRWCLVQYHGRWYQIQSFNEDYQTNEIQITAIEMANQNVTIVEPNINNSNS